MDLLDCAEDHRRGALDGPAHQVPWAVAVMYLGEPPVDPEGLAVRTGGHVAASQHAGQRIRCRIELGTQDVGESAFAGFDDGAGVVGDQSAQHGVGVLGVAQVPGAVELVQAGGGEAGGVADVVQPGGGFQQIGVRAENGCQAACMRGDALDVRPAAGQGFVEEYPGDLDVICAVLGCGVEELLIPEPDKVSQGREQEGQAVTVSGSAGPPRVTPRRRDGRSLPPA